LFSTKPLKVVNSSGPIFEIKQTTHQNPVNKEALHPYGKTALGGRVSALVRYLLILLGRLDLFLTPTKNKCNELL
jgi:hypothetical protein